MGERMSDDEVGGLIRIANGGPTKEIREPNYVEWKPTHDAYEQLDAIIKLGQSKNQNALSYIERLLIVGEPYQDQMNPPHRTHPYVRGELSSMLMIDLTEILCGIETKHPGYEHAYKIISDAKKQLEEEIKEYEMLNRDVEGLIRIANGNLKEYKRHWWIGILVSHNYSLNEQLDAIKQLGNSRNKKSLDYLTEITVQEDTKDSTSKIARTHHPHAKGELYEIFDERYWDSSIGEITVPSSHPRSKEALSIINSAISQLEKDLEGRV